MIDYVNKNPGRSSRKVASVFNCGKMQIQGILKKRAKIMEEFEKNGPENRKRHRVKDNADLVLKCKPLALILGCVRVRKPLRLRTR